MAGECLWGVRITSAVAIVALPLPGRLPSEVAPLRHVTQQLAYSDGVHRGGHPPRRASAAPADVPTVGPVTAAAMALTEAGRSRVRRGGPTTKKTKTLAATDSDQSALATAGVTPAALHRMTANVSC